MTFSPAASLSAALLALVVASGCARPNRAPIVQGLSTGAAESTRTETSVGAYPTPANQTLPAEPSTETGADAPESRPSVTPEDDEAGEPGASPDAGRSRPDDATRERWRAYVNGWDGQADQIPANGKWRVRSVAGGKASTTPPPAAGAGAGGQAAASNGQGGQKGTTVERQSFTAHGLTGQWRVHAPASNGPDKAQPLVVYFHGDTGSNYGDASLDPRINRGNAALGQPKPTLDQAVDEGKTDAGAFWKDVVVAALLTPQTNGQFITWSTNLSEAQLNALADYAAELVQKEIFTKYNIDRSKVYFVGQSGGGIFLSGTFVPRHGAKFEGGALFLCGGIGPRASHAFAPDAAFKKRFKVHFHVSGGDFLKADVDRGSQEYQRLMGDPKLSTYQNEGNGEHCIFGRSQPTIIAEVVKRMMAP